MTRFNDEENAKLLLETVPAVMRSIREEMRSIARGKFTVPQFRILNQLRKRPLTNSELAEWMGVTAPTMSRMIEPLENKQLILREYNPNDRRSQTLTLSASGKREAEKIRRQAQECFARKAETLSSDESHTLANGLKVLAKMFTDSRTVSGSASKTERTKPSMNTKSLSFIMLLMTAASLSACMGDKSVDDYAKERSRQEQAKLDSIQGGYRGTLTSKDTGQSLGSLELDLYSDTDVQDSSDNLTKIQKPVAKGTLIYTGLNQSQVSFDRYYYDDSSGILEFQIPIPDSSGQTQTVEVHATLQGNSLTGEIEILGGFSGSFTLIKDGPISQVQHLGTGRATAIAASTENFVGSSPEEGSKSFYKMQIEYPKSTAEIRFLNIFLPERTVTLSLNLNGFEVTFDANSGKGAVIDERANTLTGSMIVTVQASGHKFDLSCKRSNQGTPSEKWDCVTNTVAATHHIVFSHAASSQVVGQRG